jgi:hypothetical protein
VTTHDFISRLRDAPAKQLVFTNSDGTTIHDGYVEAESEIEKGRFLCARHLSC